MNSPSGDVIGTEDGGPCARTLVDAALAALTRSPTGAILKSLQFDLVEDSSIMTFYDLWQPVADATAVHATRRPSQRELVAWSLLRCPDDRPPRDRR
jgi:hypothetical protein